MKKLRKTQSERTETTRAKLCSATLEVIAEIGYEKTTTTMIAKRAGVSRGAQTHHFPTKFELVSAAFEYLLQDWEQKRAEATGNVEQEITAEEYIRFLWKEIFGHPQYVASLELMLAGRGDKKLHDSIVKSLREFTVLRQKIWKRILSDSVPESYHYTLMTLTVCLLRGLSMQSTIEDTNGHESEIIDAWISIVNGIVKKD
ncbi:TetR/AcrR family transcriptional regulator [Sneathiella sp.]|uniref:TetR/AcrR family transcriptional regulator n=1 Tax=Sneathiella sp. TaxID=1964365 RepID=UPI0026391100|nr:TetR/AcrR family transcriptional regulator [Sneathiella sp.]MDF2368577.1 TetR/AcrR family transcriptional regulator [Sneathiella sp.]